MITYELNNNGDIFLRNGTIATITGDDETAQDIKTKFKTVQGEVFYNITFGVPYFTVILEKPFDKDLVDTIMVETIYSSPRVTDITAFQSQLDTFARRYLLQFTATTATTENIAINEEFTLS